MILRHSALIGSFFFASCAVAFGASFEVAQISDLDQKHNSLKVEIIADDATGDIQSGRFSCDMMFCDLTVNLPAKFVPGDTLEKLFLKIDNIDFNKHSGGNLRVRADEIAYVVKLVKENGRWVLKIRDHAIKKVLISAKRVWGVPTGVVRDPAPKFYGPDNREISGILPLGLAEGNVPTPREQNQLVKILFDFQPRALQPESPDAGQGR